MRRAICTSTLGVVLLAGLAGAAQAGPITGISTSTTGAFNYVGLGADGTGRGTGYYTLGDCAFDGTNTNCIFSGNYTELTGTNPGAGGSFVLTSTYAGNAPHAPSIARSSIADPNSVGFVSPTLNGLLMTLALSPSYGGLYVATLPPFPPTGMGFSAFLAPGATCTGAPATCSIGDVGLAPGTSLTGVIRANGFQFSVPASTANVPEPATLLLAAAGLGFAAARARRR